MYQKTILWIMWGQRQLIRHETLVSYTGPVILSGNYRSAFRAATPPPRGWGSSDSANVNTIHRPLRSVTQNNDPCIKQVVWQKWRELRQALRKPAMVCITLEQRTCQREVRRANMWFHLPRVFSIYAMRPSHEHALCNEFRTGTHVRH